MIILNVFWGVHLQTGDSEKRKSLGKLILHSRDFYISLMIIFAGGRAHSPDVALSNRFPLQKCFTSCGCGASQRCCLPGGNQRGRGAMNLAIHRWLGGNRWSKCAQGKRRSRFPFHHFILSVRLLQQHTLPAVCRLANGPTVGDHRQWTGTSSGWAQSIKGTRCSSSVPTHSWPPLSQPKKNVYLYPEPYVTCRTAVWRMGAGIVKVLGCWVPTSALSLAVEVASSPLRQKKFRSEDFYFRKADLTTAICRSPSRQSGYNHRLHFFCPLSHSQGD